MSTFGNGSEFSFGDSARRSRMSIAQPTAVTAPRFAPGGQRQHRTGRRARQDEIHRGPDHRKSAIRLGLAIGGVLWATRLVFRGRPRVEYSEARAPVFGGKCLRYYYRECVGIEEENKPGELPCSATIMRDMLAALDRALDAQDLTHHVSAGTLLGLVRDGDILPWTGDLDLYLSAAAFRAAPAALRRDEEFAANYALGVWNHTSLNFDTNKYSVCLREGAPLARAWPPGAADPTAPVELGIAPLFGDLFLAHERDGIVSNGGGCRYPRHWVYPRTRLRFAGRAQETWGVANAHELLAATYGQDYMVPPVRHAKYGADAGGGNICKTYPKGHSLIPTLGVEGKKVLREERSSRKTAENEHERSSRRPEKTTTVSPDINLETGPLM